MTKLIITYRKLRKMGACKEEVAHFQEIFPNGAEWNPENLTKAYENRMDIWWFLAHTWLKLPNDEAMRKAVCKYPNLAYAYARFIDECPRDDTRKAVSEDPRYSVLYRKYIDNILDT